MGALLAMTSFFNNFKITHRLNASFALIVFMVVGLVIFSNLNIKQLQSTFEDYRTVARESILIAEVTEQLVVARLDVMKYRNSPSDKYKDEVMVAIEHIHDKREEMRKYFKDTKHLETLDFLDAESENYKVTFLLAVDEQKKRDAFVASMDELGPLIRKNLTEIMESAFRDGDPSAAFYAGKLQQDFMLARYFAKSFLVDNVTANSERVFKELAQAQKEGRDLLAELQNPRRRALANQINKGLKDYQALFTDVSNVILKRNEIYAQLDTLGPQILTGYEELLHEVEDLQKTLGNQAQQRMQNISTTGLVVGIMIALLAAGFAYLMGLFLTRNFHLIISQMDKLSGGDKGFEIKGSDRKDEIGDMGKALKIFRENALEVDRMTEAQKQAEIREAEDRKKALIGMADQFENRVGSVVQNVEKAASDMQEMASVLAAAVQETTQQSGSVAAASTEAAANVQTVAEAAEELSASIKEISRNVTDTADTARSCAHAAEVSQTKLGDLQRAVEEIDSVIQSITEVAEQTNLLALNATIEAARAGEAGKGFAVVASEVKSLAQQTHKMTDEISQKVETIKGSAKETISSVTEILKQISSVDAKTTSVSAAVEEQNSSTAEISRNVQEAANGTQEVSRNIEEVQKAANDSATSTEQLKIASDDLSTQATELRDAVQSFLNEVRTG